MNEFTEADFIKLMNDAAGQFGLKYDGKVFVLEKPYNGWLPPLTLDLDFKINKDGKVHADRLKERRKTAHRYDPKKFLAEDVVEDFFHRKSLEWCKVKPSLGLMLGRLTSKRKENIQQFLDWSAKYVLPHLFVMIHAGTVTSEEDIRKLFAEIEQLTGESIGQ